MSAYAKNREVKYASFCNNYSYATRTTPFFNTVQEVEKYEKDNEISHERCYIHPVSNWQQVIDGREWHNTAKYIPQGK